MTSNKKITVFGAYGHTGRFIIAQLQQRGWIPVLSGRDTARLQALSREKGGLEVRAASLTDASSLDHAVSGVAAVINAAGPFSLTAAPLMEAALRMKTPYIDVVAEPEIAAAAFQHYDSRAREAGIIIAPASAFYGALGSLLATAAMRDWPDADEITLAFALSSWKPTRGTRITIEVAEERRGGKRLVFSNGQLSLHEGSAARTEWVFPAPVGRQTVVEEFTTADSVALSRYVKFTHIREVMTLAPLGDLSDPDTAPPPSVDASGRSAQRFMVEAVIRRGKDERRATVSGQDIYAITAPIAVEAAERVIANKRHLSGVLSAGQISDAADFLHTLAPLHLKLNFQ
ncbi:Saccharopine dehydrogenase NADP binding domain-containing protein [Polaromonas sp. YR568]|uniref:saccharopine dehydrogenase family protein n=1 Tax=Polaromonas sp. YR568 TaxID=1855301 RepID=UPI0008E0E89C|nr:saccharopine dehydrogenase NADP-binding domain-containing protein [Polaromonas sp. YR568]SFU49533.1 Saccharopine dehydrogenase NADP binding domain-containing protein [Polaromonas sp. YR568]